MPGPDRRIREVKHGEVYLIAIVARPDGSLILREHQSGSNPEKLGELVGDILLQRGAVKILDDVYGGEADAAQP